MQIQERALEFGVRVLKFADKLPKAVGGQVLAKQLIRSGTSIGANMEEADGAASKNDFINKVAIARKEARETRYWLELINRAEMMNNKGNIEELRLLLAEALEIMKVLSAIVIKAKERR